MTAYYSMNLISTNFPALSKEQTALFLHPFILTNTNTCIKVLDIQILLSYIYVRFNGK